MGQTLTTRIDDRYRPGALNGLVQRGETYLVDKVSADELRFRRLAVQERQPARLIRKNGRLVLTSNLPLTRQEVDRALEEFP